MRKDCFYVASFEKSQQWKPLWELRFVFRASSWEYCKRCHNSLCILLSQSGGKHQFDAFLLEWAVYSGSCSVCSCDEPLNHPHCYHQPPSKQHPGWYGILAVLFSTHIYNQVVNYYAAVIVHIAILSYIFMYYLICLPHSQLYIFTHINKL